MTASATIPIQRHLQILQSQEPIDKLTDVDNYFGGKLVDYVTNKY